MSNIGDDPFVDESPVQHISPVDPPSSSNQETTANTQSKKHVVTEVTSSSGKTSWVWSHFHVPEGFSKEQRRASCTYCNKVLLCPSKNGTTCLSNHLGRCAKYPYNIEMKRQKMEMNPSQGKGERVMTTPIFDQERCRKALARMILKDELPFRFVEKEGFLDFCYELQPRFDVPSRTTMTRDCYKVFLEERKSLKQVFEKLSSSICLTTDAWTSIQNLSYLCVTAHFIDDDWTLHKKIINFCPIINHSGNVIGLTVERCLLGWGIQKILTVTVDNASSNDTGMQILRRRLNSWNGTILNGKYLHMRCVAHILNLIVKEGLKDYNDHIVKIRAAIRYVRSSPARSQKFKSCVEVARIESKSMLCLDVETRWNSTYLMLVAALKFQKAFDLMESMDKNYVAELTPQKVPTDDDWKFASNLLPFLKIFFDTTVSMSGSLYVTGNDYLRQIIGIGAFISRMHESDDSGIRDMASNMKNKYDKYWSNVTNLNVFLFIAVVLDPRFKLTDVYRIIDKTYAVENATFLKNKVITTLHDMFEVYSPAVQRKEASNQPQGFDVMEVGNSVETASFMNALYFDDEEDVNTVANKTELDVYLLEMKSDKKDRAFNILHWWKSNASRYPTLALMARDLLAIPVSTVASESAFSTGGRVLDSFRSSLSPRMVEAIICARDWLQKDNKIISLEESLEELEMIESETPGINEEHPIIDVEV